MLPWINQRKSRAHTYLDIIMNKMNVSRRQFIKSSSALAAGAMVAPYVITSHAAPVSELKIRIGLVGCGGRGIGATWDALNAAKEHGIKDIKVVAVGDVFEERAKNFANTDDPRIKGATPCFGFDNYKQVIDNPEVNYVILATPPGFRAQHFAYAVEKGKDIFTEKPVCVDSNTARVFLKAAEESVKKGLKVVGGTQRRHQQGYVETIDQIKQGVIGKIIDLRCYWNQGAIWNNPWDINKSDMENQLRNWYHYLWLCGDHIVEQHVHNVDVCNWIKGEHPVRAYGMGGREALKGPGQIWDHFAVDYEYADGTRMYSQCRQIDNTDSNVSEYVVGTNGSSNPSGNITFNTGKVWRAKQGRNPYVQEHMDLMTAIATNNKKVNEAKTVAESCITAIMGRESAYSGRKVTWEDIIEGDQNLVPDNLVDMNSPVKPWATPCPNTYELF